MAMKYKVNNHRCPITGENYISFRHSSGLTVLFCNTPYTASHAVYAVNYGGACDSFERDGTVYEIPAGIAHFLEHKLFETESGGDAYDLFSQTGADANAYTSYTNTAYLFTASEEFYTSLKILLDFVNDPHWTEASVKKEQGIITQELKMYEDSPWSRVHTELMKCLYKHHPVRHEIVGTEESISRITPEYLYLCHSAFYTPENMVLSIAGDLDIDRICRVLDTVKFANTGKSTARAVYKPENSRIRRRVSRVKMEVSSPLFSFGVRDIDIPKDPKVRLKKALALNIYLDTLFGESSELYNALYDAGLISGAMYAGCSYCDGFSYSTVSGESEKPFTVKKRIKSALENAAARGIGREDFEITKKLIYSAFIKSLTSSQNYASEMLNGYFDGIAFTDIPKAVADLGYDEALEYARQVFKEENYAFSTVEPLV